MKRENFIVTVLLASLASVFASASAQAQATIDQNKALAGNVTPGDAPGFPVTISARGAYKLTGNLVVPAGLGGILVTASEVSIDLNGYSITGPNTCTGFGATLVCTLPAGTGDGIKAAAGVTDVHVHHGAVDGFQGQGVLLNDRSTVDHLKAQHNGNYGVVVGDYSSVGQSILVRNNSGGVYASGGLVFDTIAHGNSGIGFVIGFSSRTALIRNNLATHNSSDGFQAQGLNTSFVDNQANKNGKPGINAPSQNGNLKMPGNVCNGGAC